ncbi:GrpB family protein [Streptococcus catagoni]|uniref:GrpB family protein n=1 Tax=Streptococcus catagoni TaxID=2654874 RepID=UPI00140A8E0B|nr:GrpB family protein [Streptococcus catagoni]
MRIEVVPYRSTWAKDYLLEEEKIKAILGESLLACHHIGSTSVEGQAAKPIIDIMPVVKKISDVDSVIPNFEALGYQSLGENGIPGRRFFRKGGDLRTHHIHVFEESNQNDIKRHLALRDYLRTHSSVSRDYSQLKSQLAKTYPYDIDAYCNGKDAFVKQMEQDALDWYEKHS